MSVFMPTNSVLLYQLQRTCSASRRVSKTCLTVLLKRTARGRFIPAERGLVEVDLEIAMLYVVWDEVSCKMMMAFKAR